MYRGPDSTLGELGITMFSWKLVAGLIKPDTLPPTEGEAAHHCLPTDTGLDPSTKHATESQ